MGRLFQVCKSNRMWDFSAYRQAGCALSCAYVCLLLFRDYLDDEHTTPILGIHTWLDIDVTIVSVNVFKQFYCKLRCFNITVSHNSTLHQVYVCVKLIFPTYGGSWRILLTCLQARSVTNSSLCLLYRTHYSAVHLIQTAGDLPNLF